MAWAGSVHMICAYWGFVFMSIHLGFHWNMMIGMVGRLSSKGQGVNTKIGSIIMQVLAVLIAGYGVFAFIKRDIWNYMTLKNHFAFFDFSEPVTFFLLDYLAVMGLFVFIGHYFGRILMLWNKSRKGR